VTKHCQTNVTRQNNRRHHRKPLSGVGQPLDLCHKDPSRGTSSDCDHVICKVRGRDDPVKAMALEDGKIDVPVPRERISRHRTRAPMTAEVKRALSRGETKGVLRRSRKGGFFNRGSVRSWSRRRRLGIDHLESCACQVQVGAVGPPNDWLSSGIPRDLMYVSCRNLAGSGKGSSHSPSIIQI
jgi:hypothetical protein